MKTYKAKSSLNRAAKRMGIEPLFTEEKGAFVLFESKEEKELYEEYGAVECPHCGTHLSNGVASDSSQKAEGLPRMKKFEYACLSCNKEFGPKLSTTAKRKIERKDHSSVKSPCTLVWSIAEEMPDAPRKDVIAACVEKGVAYNTARTQYQQWRTAIKNQNGGNNG